MTPDDPELAAVAQQSQEFRFSSSVSGEPAVAATNAFANQASFRGGGREGIEAWFDAGIKTPIIVPSSANGGQFAAFEEFFSIWD